MAKSYYQRAHGIILACALDNKNSFYNLRNWLNSIKDNTQADSIQLIIIANKCDLVNEREVNREEIEKKAKELNIEYFETSAKENINLDDAFNTIIEKVYKGVYNRPKGFDLNSKDEDQILPGRKCC
jgi:GTPase SAR1 family protein